MSEISYTSGRGQVVLKAFKWDRKSLSSGTLEQWHLKGTWWWERSWRLSHRWWDMRSIYNDWYRGAWMPEDKVKHALNWSDVNEWSITHQVINVVQHQAPSVPKCMKSGGRCYEQWVKPFLNCHFQLHLTIKHDHTRQKKSYITHPSTSDPSAGIS